MKNLHVNAHNSILLLFFLKILFFLRGEWSKKGRARNIDVPEIYIDELPLSHTLTGDWPATQVCALTGNQTSDLSLCGTMPNQLGNTSQG